MIWAESVALWTIHNRVNPAPGDDKAMIIVVIMLMTINVVGIGAIVAEAVWNGRPSESGG